MKYYEVGFDAGVCYSCNIIQGETESACRYAAEQHAKRYGYTVGYFNEIDAAALEYNRKPVWSADEYPQPTEPEQPEQEPETAEETETEQEENEMKNVLDSIQNAAQKVAADRAAYIAAHTMTAAEARNAAFVRECSTPKQWERIAAMQDAEPIAAADIDKLTAKAVKRVQKSAADAAAKVQTVAQNAVPQSIRLYITWTRSAVWGWNPHCTLTTWTENGSGYKDETTHGRASGCGYDKTSAARAEALNASDIVRGALVRFVNDGGSNYGVYTAETLNYPVCPYFEGGCGMSTITETLRKMGYKVTDTTHYTRRGTEECRIIEASREV